MAKRGRPRVLDETKQGEAWTLLACGMRLRTVARWVGCAPCTLRREIRRNEQFRQKMELAKHGLEAHWLDCLVRAAPQYPGAAAWLRKQVEGYVDDRRGKMPRKPAGGAQRAESSLRRNGPEIGRDNVSRPGPTTGLTV